MAFALLGMHILEVLFFTGIIGSSVVVLITSIEDAQELLGSDEPSETPEKTQPAT